MTYLAFITTTGIIGLVGALLFSSNNKWMLGRLLIPLLALLFCGTGFAEYYASIDHDLVAKAFWVRTSVVLHFLIGITLLELTVSFLGNYGLGRPLRLGTHSLRLRHIWRPAAAVCIDQMPIPAEL